MKDRRKLDKSKMLTLIPALWASFIDIGLTIHGQSSNYWNGDLNLANETNPIGAFFMTNHVSGIFLISGFWVLLIVILGYFLPKRISKVFLLFALISHSWGASSWFQNEYFYIGAIILFLFNSILYVFIDEISSNKTLTSLSNKPYS